MQTPGVKKRFAAERERLGLPVDGIEEMLEEAEATEEGEAQVAAKGTDAVTAPPTQSAVVADVADSEEALSLDDELVATDGAFEVEQSPELPPLKFRVGPAAHLVLTPQGWRRTKRDMKSRLTHNILKRNEFLKEYVARKMEMFESELDDVVTSYSERTAQEVAQDAARMIDRIGQREEAAMIEDPVNAQEVDADASIELPTAAVEDATTLHETATDEVEASTQEDAVAQGTNRASLPPGPIHLTAQEKKQLRKDVRRVFRAEAEGMLEKEIDKIIERAKEGQKRRNMKSKQRRWSRERAERVQAA